MARRALILMAAIFMAWLARAQALSYKVAVLELNNRAKLTEAENIYLTDRVRDAMIRSLPSESFMIMTRESIQELLPPEMRVSDCADAECEIEIGRMLGAAYIVTGDVLLFAGKYRLNLKVHHCESAAFLGSEVARGDDLVGLEGAVRETAALLGERMREHSGVKIGGSLPGVFREGGGSEAPEDEWRIGDIHKAVVRFESNPPGAVVLVDGRIICVETPCSKELGEGPVRVSMQKERYLPREETVEIRKSGSDIKLSWTLDPDFGWLTVRTKPSGLSVEIDGKEYGDSPINDLELSPGGHRVKVTDRSYYSAWKDIMIERGARREVQLELKPREGGLLISAVDKVGDAVAAEVRVDGKLFGTTPCGGELIVGDHQIDVRSTRGSWQGVVAIEERVVDTLRVKLDGSLSSGALSSIGIKMVPINPGTFQMGSSDREKGRGKDESQHKVWISKAYLISTTEVTQAQWIMVMGENPSHFKGDDQPVERVTWFEAIDFCNRLSEREGLDPVYKVHEQYVSWDRGKRGYRLPTEAEWEYACRAGTKTRIYTGDNKHDLLRAGWYKENSDKKTHPVGQLDPNDWDLYDMHGNVWEWCWDWYDSYPIGNTVDPAGPGSGNFRVLRGGSWRDDSRYCRSASRNWLRPVNRLSYNGLRLVLDL
ncbi:MAG: SUMF1/EgtB/PvdO family nonheme iron enzyme [Candidatus Krumholzibacteriota bacterium]|nr:SUMF1/EgtB/PvdO family nonheme iron enzyme [Candidatus Krumholzibacteriota bacterium]